MRISFKSIIKVLGIITFIEGLFMLPCVVAALYFEEWKAGGSLFVTSIVCISIGFVILTQLKFDKIRLKLRESYFIACTSWIFASLFLQRSGVFFYRMLF